MRTATFNITGLSEYSGSKPVDESNRQEKESPSDYDKRIWRERIHYDRKTKEVFIPPMAFKWAIAEAAKRLSIKIPGKRMQTYTKNILSGVIPTSPSMLGIKRDETECEEIYANADGRRGSGTRVFRRYPLVPKPWTSTLVLAVIDDEIPEEVLERCVREAGNLIGVGRFRPERGGYLGRFEVTKVKWH